MTIGRNPYTSLTVLWYDTVMFNIDEIASSISTIVLSELRVCFKLLQTTKPCLSENPERIRQRGAARTLGNY